MPWKSTYTGDFNSTKQVIRVISSDSSVHNAFENPNIDGDSYVSIICSAAPLQVSSNNGTKHTFQEMCKNGFIRDVGDYIEHIELSYSSDGNWTQKFPMLNTWEKI